LAERRTVGAWHALSACIIRRDTCRLKLPNIARATRIRVVNVQIISRIALTTCHRKGNGCLAVAFSSHAHAPRLETLQHAASNHHCSSSKLARPSAAACRLGMVSDHARVNPFNTTTGSHLQARVPDLNASGLEASVASLSHLKLEAATAYYYYTCCRMHELPLALASSAAACVAPHLARELEFVNVWLTMVQYLSDIVHNKTTE